MSGMLVSYPLFTNQMIFNKNISVELNSQVFNSFITIVTEGH